MRSLVVVLFLAACTTAPADPQQPDGGSGTPVYVPNSVGAAIGFVAQSVCDRDARCGTAPDGCVDDAVRSYCESHDCDAAYHDWTRLEQCVDSYDGLACVTTFPPSPCQL